MNRYKNYYSSLVKRTKAIALVSFLFAGIFYSCSKTDGPVEEPSTGNQTLDEKVSSAAPNLSEQPQDTILKDTIPQGTAPKDTIPAVPEAKIEERTYKLSDLEGMIYEFEVVFHLLSSPGSELNDRFTSQRADSLLAKVNALYAGEMGGEDVKVRFVLASKQPDGSPMQEKGILRGTISEAKLSYFQVTNDSKGGVYHSQSWDIKRYINVYIFMFSEHYTRGVSTYPSLTDEHPLRGLGTYVSDFHNRKHTCVAINENILGSWRKNTQGGIIASTKQVRTLAHELGHYLGLYHAFRGQNNPEDYCDDTKEYDRPLYEANLATTNREIAKLYADQTGGSLGAVARLKESLYMRKPLDGSAEYLSVNIMDYEHSYGNQFTKDQVKRIRHCLYYSPTLPGPKVAQSKESSLRSAMLPRTYGSRTVVCAGTSLPFPEE